VEFGGVGEVHAVVSCAAHTKSGFAGQKRNPS
jgi:hypothetical protein